MSSVSVADSSTRPASVYVEDYDAYNNPNSGSVLQAEVVLSSSMHKNNFKQDQRPSKEAEEGEKLYFDPSSDEKGKEGNSVSRLFLVLYTILFLSIVFLVVALVRYIRVKRSILAIPVPQDKESTETLTPVEVADPDRDPIVYRSNIEQILFRELHEECSTNFLEGPQKMAIDWLIYEDLVLDSTQVEKMANQGDDAFPLVQRYSMMVLFFGTSGELWSGAHWNLMPDIFECQFMGVECNMDGQVLVLDLAFRKLRGRLPEEVGMLTNMRSFSVLSNSLEGTIPLFLYDRLTNLDFLDLSKNQLSSSLSSDISKLSKLQVLHLAELSLTGEIPVDSMKTLTNLEQIVISYAPRMKGPLLELSEYWPNLSTFDTYLSGFTGSIPTSIGQNTNLQFLWLEGVPMDMSTIPTELGLLTNLEEIILRPNGNGVGGATIPTEIGLCKSLTSMEASHFSGQIPTEIGLLTNLKHLVVEDGTMTGTVPSEIGLLTDLIILRIVGNRLTGTLPLELGNLTNLEKLDVYANNLSGRIPNSVCQFEYLSIDRDCSVQACECCDQSCRNSNRRY